MAQTAEEILNEWLNKEVNVEIKSIDDEQLFTLVLGQMLIDCFNEPQFKQWLNSDNVGDKMKAGMSLARPVLSAYMYAKANSDILKGDSDGKSGQDSI